MLLQATKKFLVFPQKFFQVPIKLLFYQPLSLFSRRTISNNSGQQQSDDKLLKYKQKIMEKKIQSSKVIPEGKIKQSYVHQNIDQQTQINNQQNNSNQQQQNDDKLQKYKQKIMEKKMQSSKVNPEEKVKLSQSQQNIDKQTSINYQEKNSKLNDQKLVQDEKTNAILNKILKQAQQMEDQSNNPNTEKKETTQKEENQEEFANIQDVFQTREQLLSFKLMNVDNPTQVLELYKEERKIDPTLKPDELSLFFYFATYYKQDLSKHKEFQEILNELMINIDQVSPHCMITLVWAIGIYKYEHKLYIPEKHLYNLSQHILKCVDNFQYNQLSSLALATSQIFNGQKEIPLAQAIVKKLADNACINLQIQSNLEIINFIMTFLYCKLNDQQLIDKFVQRILDSKDDLEEDELNKIISAVSDLGYKNNKNIEALVQAFLSKAVDDIQNIGIDAACGVILSLSQSTQNKTLLNELLKVVHSKNKEINITNYVNLWLSLAKFKINVEHYEKTINILKHTFVNNNIFKPEELEGFEIINIIVAFSALKLNDRDFISQIIKYLDKKLDKLDKQDLINLARSFIVYVRQFEDFYVKIHHFCGLRYKQFDEDEKNLLKQTFTRVKALLPGSPFLA